LKLGKTDDNMNDLNYNELPAISDSLILYVHSGGSIISTTTSSESFLLEFAHRTDIPIVSIDYSLSPEAPYPRAIEEVFYTYCWLLKNGKFCGSLCKNIIIVGSSIGIHFSTNCIFKCIENNVQIPNRMVSIFGCVSINYDLFPSRFFTFLDPLLPHSLVELMLDAYSSEKPQEDLVLKKSRNYISKISRGYQNVPWAAKDEILKNFPPVSFICGTMDAVLDENITFGRKLSSLGVDVTFIPLSRIPHGFISHANVSLIPQEFKFNFNTFFF
jgi:acetyl esterase/lipase